MERDTMPVDVVFVGAGPANLAAIWRLGTLLEQAGRAGDFELMLVEKGRAVGDHILSGAVMDPRGMAALFGDDWRDQGCPVDADVTEESVQTLTSTTARKLPFMPPPLKNHGNVIVSLSEVVRWMRDRIEQRASESGWNVMIAEGQPAAEVLLDGARVRGVRLVDRGRDKHGNEGPAFEPGADIEARVTVLGEGSRGSLTKQLVEALGLRGRNPQVYGTGVKEVWDIPPGRIHKGAVRHTAGWPLENHQYGGSWIYALSETRLSLGFVVGLDGRDPGLDPYELMQTWKTHPSVRTLLLGGSVVKSGTKTLPEGGWWSRPRSHGDGFLIIGDSGSMLNIARLKGIHTAIQSGIFAGETIAEVLLSEDSSGASLAAYEHRVQDSDLKRELWRVRNWRQAFARYGFARGQVVAGLRWALGGKIHKSFVPIHADYQAMLKGQSSASRTFKPDNVLTFDKLKGVYDAGATHEENQPAHLVISDTDLCATRCREEYGNPCERFCPASVYEMVDDGRGGLRMQVNFSNCVHCKTCDVADPYQVITWTVPEDNGGPRYLGL